MVHRGHFNFLRHMRERCKKVIVGLTTDALAIIQKRIPMMAYEQRKDILESCKFVDIVVEHTGLSKEDDYKHIRFDALFIGSDYVGAEEYGSFASTHNVPVIYVPRTSSVSTSAIIHCVSSRVQVLHNSNRGTLLDINGTIHKIIPVGYHEYGNTSDTYQLPIPRPRNVPYQLPKQYPDISGVNSMREIWLTQALIGQAWCPVHYITNTTHKHYTETHELFNERSNPYATVDIIQRHAGICLREWWVQGDVSDEDRKRVYARVLEVIVEIHALGIVHNDLHLDNICITPDKDVNIIDFGWALYHCFEMNDAERRIYNGLLQNKHDLMTFKRSMRVLKYKSP